MAKILSKSDFLARLPRGVKVHPVDVGGDTFFVRELSVPQRTKFDLSLDKKKHPGALEKLREKLLVATVCDEAGNLFFAPGDEADLRDVLCSGIEPIFAKSAEVNGISQRDIEDVKKNSETDPTNS